MATPSEKLAQSLEELKKLQNDRGIAVVKSGDLSRIHKERLVKNGFLKEVVKGWYISAKPDERDSDTTTWYMSFWYFASVYCNNRFGEDWCLSPEQSLSLHAGNLSIPRQLLVRSLKATNNNLILPHNTSIFDTRLATPSKEEKAIVENMQVYSLESGLIACSADFFSRKPTDARTCLSLVKDTSVLLVKLLDGGHSVVAGRLAGAFHNIGNDKAADTILKVMKSAGYDVRINDPFAEKISVRLKVREASPYTGRIKLMWHQMRDAVIDIFPVSKQLPYDISAYLKQVDKNYPDDAYNSLSIEGYHVTGELIERVRRGDWNPEENVKDKTEHNAMAARGYYQAFLAVKKSIIAIHEGKNAGMVAEDDHGIWYRELFAPGVAAGLLNTSDLAGYRNSQVYIKGSKHTPLNRDAVRDVMPVFFSLLREEENPGVRAVLGHFIFVYIHPYMDGNGRIGRFLFNTMLASGGYPWTVIPFEKRDAYMTFLEKASVESDITGLTGFLGELVKQSSR